MKKILVISSSPRKGGNSDALCDEFIKGASCAGHEAEKIFLWEKEIGYCRGCGNCLVNKGNCSQNDDMGALAQKMLEADVIVLATPVYFYSVSGKIKTFIDRCCPYFTTMKNKEFYYIVSAADDDKGAMKRAVECLRGFTVCTEGMEEKGIIYGIGVHHAGDILQKTPIVEQAYNMGFCV